MKIYLLTNTIKDDGTVVIMPNIFHETKYEIDDYCIKFEYNQDLMQIDITSENSEELESVFWDLYEYIGIIFGYFPIIKQASFLKTDELNNIVERYKTKDCFIRNSDQFIKKIDCSKFKKTFKAFREIKSKAELQLLMLNIAMMEKNCYPELALVNVLQSLDGLFSTIFECEESKKKILENKYNKAIQKIENFKRKKYKEFGNSIKENINKIEDIHFIDKLTYLINYCMFDIFKYEKLLKEGEKYKFDNLLTLLVNTRNKISHSVEKEKVLNGKESALYIFKFIILYRLLIFQKIELIDLVEKNLFEKNLSEWDRYIGKNIKNEGEVSKKIKYKKI